MANKREHFCLSLILGIGIILMCLGLFSISSTLAYNNEVYATTWNVYFTKPQLKSTNLKNTLFNSQNKINFKVAFDDYDEKLTFTTLIKNDGDYDATLLRFNKTNFKNILLISDASKDYYLSDFVTFSVQYASNNPLNDTKVDTNIGAGDLLRHNSYNKLIVTIHFLAQDKLDPAAQKAIACYLEEHNNTLEVEGYIEALFKQL